MAGERITLYGRMREFTQVRADGESWRSLNQNIRRGALRQLERGFSIPDARRSSIACIPPKASLTKH